MDGGAAMLGFWVRLGEELGAVYGLEPVLVSVGRKRRKRSEFCRGKGGELQGFWVLDAFSLRTMRRVEGGEDLEVLSSWGGQTRAGIQIPTGGSTAADGEAVGEKTGSKCLPGSSAEC